MSDEPDHERVRALIVELDKVQQESERIRERIAKIEDGVRSFPMNGKHPI